MKLVLAIACCLLQYVTAGQTAFTKQVWINEPDVPVNVTDITQQRNGYIWLCTSTGIFRFNGRAFTKINDTNSVAATTIHAASDKVYVGYKDGRIIVINEQGTMPLTFKNGHIRSSITAIKNLHNDVLLIATEEGIYLSINGNLVSFNSKNGLSDDFISDIEVSKDKVALATDGGTDILTIKDHHLDIQKTGGDEGVTDIITTCVCVSPDGSHFWIGTQQGGIAIYDNDQKRIIPLRLNTPWSFGQVNDLLVLNADHAWAVTDNNFLLELKRSKDSVIITPTLMPVKLKKIVCDKTGNIWCATNKGLLMSTASYLSFIHLSSSFNLNSYTAITCDRKEQLWFTQGNKLYHLRSSNDTLPVLVRSLPADITCLHISDSKGIWIGTFGKGLYYSPHNGSLQQIPLSSSPNEHILNITHTDSKLWVASFNGLDVLDIRTKPVVLRHYNKHNGTGSDYIYQLHTDAKDQVWMATDGGGVVMYNGREFNRWDSTSGLKSDVFYSVTTDSKGNVWASSLDQGVYHYDGNRWRTLKKQEGLQHVNVTAIAPNGDQNLIVVNRYGIDQWYANDHQFRHFNRSLGINIDSSSRILNCITSDKYGNTYLPFEEGILVFKNNPSIHVKPYVHILKQSLFFKDLPMLRRHFSANENHISFTYNGINYTHPQAMYYRYKLEGYDNTWVYTQNETIPFARLNSGNYTFRVQASLSNNFINASEDSFTFHIDKPFWQTLWFLFASAFTVLALLYFIIKRREYNIVKLNQLQRERLVYEYEHLKSQVNPHFLFNSFNTLVHIIDEDKHAAIDYTVHLSDFYRNILSYKDKDLIPLKEEYEIIQSYIYIQKSRFGDALTLHLDIEEHLLHTKMIVPLALQILLENAIKHNIVSASNPLHIYITANDEELVVKNNLQLKITRDKGMGIGMENIRKRYRLLTKRPISYGIVNNEYIVTLPLL